MIQTATGSHAGCRYGLPTSSSQCITGAIVGVGLAEGRGGRGVNWRLFAKQFASWVMTLVVVGLGVAALFAQVHVAAAVISGCVVCMKDLSQSHAACLPCV